MVFVEDLAQHHGFQFAVMRRHAVVVEMCRYLQSGVADGVERQDRNIEIEQVGIIAVDHVERTVVEIGAILTCRQAGTIAPSPLAVDGAVVPAVLAQRVVLGVKVLRVVAFPPFAFAVGFRQSAVIRYSRLRPFCVVPL